MLQVSHIRAVTFDVGGTLIEPWPSVGHVYAEVAARHGHENLSPDELNRQFTGAWRAKKDFDHSRPAWRRLVEQTFANVMAAPPDQVMFDDLYHCFAGAAAWRVFDDVRPALGQLKERQLGLAIISNWDERLRPLLDQLDLSQYFAVTIISMEAGVTKPDKKIFRRVADELGLPPRAILHVGDSPAEDVAGANAAGMPGVLLDRKLRSANASAINTLAELARLLEERV